MIGFKDFLKERYTPITTESPHYSKILSDLSKMKGPVLLKGISPSRGFDPILASSMRDPSGDWYGIDDEIDTFRKLAIKKIIHEKMGIKHPVFTTNNPFYAYYFGSNICIVVPRPPENLKVWISSEIEDLLNDLFDRFSEMYIPYEESASYYKKMEPDSYNEYSKMSEILIKSFFDSYTKFNSLPKNINNEIILDTKEYWLIPLNSFISNSERDLKGLTYEKFFEMLKNPQKL